MVSNLIFRWGNSYVDPSKRASYTAGKEIISLLTGMMVSFGAGFLIDRFEKEGNTEGGFIFAAIAILIFCISDLCMLLLIKNDVKPKAERGNETSLKDILINTLGNRNFMSVVVLAIMWDSSRYLVIGFMGTYKNSLYALGTVQIINVVSQLARAVFSKPFGIYTSKRTFAKGIELGLVVAASAMLANVFTTPATAFMVIVYSLLYSICCAGIMGNIANITYNYVDSRYFVEASAIKNSIAGLFGFGVSLIGGKILSAVQNNGNMIFGISVHGQQVLSAISFLMLILTILFTHFIVSKQKVMIQ
jgi:Na+/melibiose symporter-like transporter